MNERDMDNEFGNMIRQSRVALGLSIKETASGIAVDPSLLSRWEAGERRPMREQVVGLSHVLHLPTQDLLSKWLSQAVYELLKDEPVSPDRVMEDALGYFSSATPAPKKTAGIPPKLLKEIDRLKAVWDALHPLNPVQIKNLDEFFGVQTTYESNRIEGNTLTLQETTLVITKGLTVGGKSLREHLEAINHYEAVDFVRHLATAKKIILEHDVLQIHQLVLRGIDSENAGRYRRVDVRITGSEHRPPGFYALAEEMQAFFRFYRRERKRMHPVLLAAKLHRQLVQIHPFADGNGRTSRLLGNLILLQNGYPLAIFKGDMNNRLAYYTALEEAHVLGNTETFVRFAAETVRDSLKEWVQAVKGK